MAPSGNLMQAVFMVWKTMLLCFAGMQIIKIRYVTMSWYAKNAVRIFMVWNNQLFEVLVWKQWFCVWLFPSHAFQHFLWFGKFHYFHPMSFKNYLFFQISNLDDFLVWEPWFSYFDCLINNHFGARSLFENHQVIMFD